MITVEDLNSIEYVSNDTTLYSIPGEWEYEFNIKTQELWNINDGVGEPVFICKVTNFEKLKELLELRP
jgi:hypothetical protein